MTAREDDRATYAIGVGLSSGATAGEVADLVAATLLAGGVPRDRVRRLGTIAGLAEDSRLVGLGWPTVAFPAAVLAAVDVPSAPSPHALAGLGTPSVAEAAALLAAGRGARIVVPKQRSARATAAVAHR